MKGQIVISLSYPDNNKNRIGANNGAKVQIYAFFNRLNELAMF